MRSITIQSNGQLVSSLIADNAEHALTAGVVLQAQRILEISDEIIIQQGEQGTVVEVDVATGAAEVLMDLCHKGLCAWDNHILLMPYDTDDILGGLKVILMPA